MSLPKEQITAWPMVDHLAITLAEMMQKDFTARFPQAPVRSQAFEVFCMGLLQGASLCGAMRHADMAWWYERIMGHVYGASSGDVQQ